MKGVVVLKDMALVCVRNQPLALKRVMLEKPDGTEWLVTVVARPEDVDIGKGRISKDSPLGKALVAGEDTYKLPDGRVEKIKIIREEATNNGNNGRVAK